MSAVRFRVSQIMPTTKLNIAVLVGGPSPEHEISLKTGAMILKSLDKNKYRAQRVLITPRERWIFKNKTPALNTREALRRLKSEKVDVAFVAIHGAYGEDGTIQKLLNGAHIPYTGSGLMASRRAIDKLQSATRFAECGLTIPRFINFSYGRWQAEPQKLTRAIEKSLQFPCVIKPHNGGSSIGVTMVKAPAMLPGAIQEAARYSDKIIAQKYIKGREVTCAILDEGGNKKPLALPPTEIIPKTRKFFDYHAKYTPCETEEITPPRLPHKTIKKIQRAARTAHAALNCSGMSRTDMIVYKDDIYVLETNTIPGMTETSLYPQAAAAVGISFSELLDRIIQSALNKKKK